MKKLLIGLMALASISTTTSNAWAKEPLSVIKNKKIDKILASAGEDQRELLGKLYSKHFLDHSKKYLLVKTRGTLMCTGRLSFSKDDSFVINYTNETYVFPYEGITAESPAALAAICAVSSLEYTDKATDVIIISAYSAESVKYDSLKYYYDFGVLEVTTIK